MQDIFKKYKKNKIKNNIGIILTSLVLAFGINFFLLNNSQLAQNLKTSVLNSKIQNNKSDISLEKIDNTIFIVSNKNISKVTDLSLSINYNPENINIDNISSNLGDIINLSNTSGMNSIILTFKTPTDILNSNKLIKINITKKNPKTENINVINANFKDINNIGYTLSTSGITF